MFKEEFAFIIPAGESDTIFDAEAGSYRREFVESVLSDLRSADIDTDGAQVESTSHGYGADGLSLLVILGFLTAVFLQGKKIEENYDAWIRLGRRFQQAVQRLGRRGLGARVSEPVAAALAVAEVVRTAPKGSPVEVLSSVILPVSNSSLAPEYLNQFRWYPDRYYVFVMQVGDEVAQVMCVTSDGRILPAAELPLTLDGFLKGPSLADSEGENPAGGGGKSRKDDAV